MPNSLNWPERKGLQFRLNLNRHLLRKAAARSPRAFRRHVRIVADSPLPFSQFIQPWQQRDLAALDAAWMQLAGFPAQASHRRAYIERPRGHAKTADMALQIAWILQYAPHRLQGLAAAADRDQASLIHTAVQRLVQLNPDLCPDLDFRQHAVLNSKTGSRLEVISSDVRSSWGSLPDFVICDELCHWEGPALWESLFSSAAKRPQCVLTVLTNAGVGRGWQWQVRDIARQNPRWYFSTLAGPHAPWITPESLQEQRDLLPPTVFDRLWMNIWQETGGEFISLTEAEACRDPQLTPQEKGHTHHCYVAAIDYAEKHDYTAAVLIHREGERIIVDRLDVIRPLPDQPTPVAWVENWIREIHASFPNTTFVIDEYQLLGTIQSLSHLCDLRRFEFLAGKGNHALAVNLRKLILHRELAWFPGCGALEVPWGRDDLETELASLILHHSPTGRCRIDHIQDTTHHDDRAFALGAACLHLTQHHTQPDWLEITPPSHQGTFAW